MNNDDYKDNSEMLPEEKNDSTNDQSKDIIDVIKDLNEEINNPDYQTYKKTTYWHHQASDTKRQEEIWELLLENLQKIETIVSSIETLLRTQYETNTKR